MVEVKNGAAGAVQRSHKVGQAGKNDFFGGLMLFRGFLNVDGLGIFNIGWGYMVFFTVYLLFVQWMGMVLFFWTAFGVGFGGRLATDGVFT